MVRSVRHAQAAEAALRARVAKAKAQVEALNQRGRGRKRFEEIETLRQAVNAIVQRHRVEDFLWLRYDQHTTTRPVRAYQERPAYVKEEHHATVEVRVDEVALESAVRRLGWRVYSTNQPAEQFSLAQAVLAYRSEYLVETKSGATQRAPAVAHADVCAARRPCHGADSVVIDCLAGVDAVGVRGASSVGG